MQTTTSGNAFPIWENGRGPSTLLVSPIRRGPLAIGLLLITRQQFSFISFHFSDVNEFNMNYAILAISTVVVIVAVLIVLNWVTQWGRHSFLCRAGADGQGQGKLEIYLSNE